jgi:hypothetical protein
MQHLQEQGHVTSVTSATKEKLIEAGMKFQKGRHERAQEKLPADDPNRRAWKRVEDQVRQGFDARFSSSADDEQYCYSLSIGFGTGLRMLKLLIPVLGSDACHNKGSSAGSMTYTTLALDADHHLVPLVVTYHVGEESAEGWNAHFDVLVPYLASCTELDPQDWTIIIDGIPSGVKACEERGFHTFMCSKHLVKHMNAAEERVYLRALHAKTPQELSSIKQELPQFFEKLESKHSPRQLYMVMSGQLAGLHTQSPVESFNAMLDKKARRAQHPLGDISFYTCTFRHVCMYESAYGFVYIYVCVCIYIYTYICMYIYIYTYISVTL